MLKRGVNRSSGRIMGMAAVISLIAAPLLGEGAEMGLEVLTGAVYNVPLRLKIHQHGEPDLSLRARFETRPFESPVYYAVRISRWAGNSAWEGELAHHKLFLRNPPPEVEAFSISHGYNLGMVNRALRRNGIIYRLGVGVVIAHPETSVRGRRYSEKHGIFHRGYYITGPTFQFSVGKPVPLGGGFHVVPEVKLTGSFARIPVAGGRADVPNAALHGLLGLGYGNR